MMYLSTSTEYSFVLQVLCMPIITTKDENTIKKQHLNLTFYTTVYVHLRMVNVVKKKGALLDCLLVFESTVFILSKLISVVFLVPLSQRRRRLSEIQNL